MRFEIDRQGATRAGQLVYEEIVQGFDFAPVRSVDYSMLVGDIEVGIAEYAYGVKRGHQIDGYHPDPFRYAVKRDLVVPRFCSGYLSVVDDTLADEDIPIFRLSGSREWLTYCDPATGWVCIGEVEVDGGEGVEFLEHVVAVIKDGDFRALWLKPVYLPTSEKDVYEWDRWNGLIRVR